MNLDELRRLTQRPYPHIPMPVGIKARRSVYRKLAKADIGLPLHIDDSLPSDPGYEVMFPQPDGTAGPAVGSCSGPPVKTEDTPLIHPGQQS